jgi:hypothetical protein
VRKGLIAGWTTEINMGEQVLGLEFAFDLGL